MQLTNFEDAKKLLSKYKISFPRTVFALPAEVLTKAGFKKDFLKVINSFKYPIFLKVYGKDILHRTDIGGVGEANNKIEAKKEFLRMIKIKGTDGVIIQEEVDGKSLIIGMKRDLQFGPVIIVGIGGIFTEILNDFVLRVAPISEKDALKMIAELKGYNYLIGKRDKKSINFKAVAKIIVSLSNLAIKETEIKEIDLNPVISNAKIASAVDFKFLV